MWAVFSKATEVLNYLKTNLASSRVSKLDSILDWGNLSPVTASTIRSSNGTVTVLDITGSGYLLGVGYFFSSGTVGSPAIGLGVTIDSNSIIDIATNVAEGSSQMTSQANSVLWRFETSLYLQLRATDVGRAVATFTYVLD